MAKRKIYLGATYLTKMGTTFVPVEEVKEKEVVVERKEWTNKWYTINK